MVPERRWAHLRRRSWTDRFRQRSAETDDRGAFGEASVDLNDEEHAWWAAREELETGRVPRGRKGRSATKEPPPTNPKGGFESYYTAESLFDSPGNGDGVGVLDETDPYVVLGVPASATWDEITSAHRRLAKLHHPDRLVDATPEQRESGEGRIRELNIAYMELRRRKGK